MKLSFHHPTEIFYLFCFEIGDSIICFNVYMLLLTRIRNTIRSYLEAGSVQASNYTIEENTALLDFTTC